MLVDVFIDLYKGGILRRKVYPDPVIQEALNDGELKEIITPETARAVLDAPSLNPLITAQQFDSLQHCGFFKPGLRYVDYQIMGGEKAYSPDLRDEVARNRILADCIGDHLQNGIVAHGCFLLGQSVFMTPCETWARMNAGSFL